MDTTFWMAVAMHYFWLGIGITTNPAYLVFTAITFLTIPQVSNIELVPGIQTSMETQLEAVKTMRYLSKKGDYP